MVGRRGRPGKRKVEELQDEISERKPKPKEARIEAISLDGSEPAHVTLLTLQPDVWTQDAPEEGVKDAGGLISRPETHNQRKHSQGTYWRGSLEPRQSKVALSCVRESNGDETFDCGTQTLHFTPVVPSKVVVVPDSNSAETIKVEIDDEQEEFVSHPLVCCAERCDMLSNIDNTTTFYTVPKGRERTVWAETFNFILSNEGDVRQHICSKHFMSCDAPKTPIPAKPKTRKKKTCDMLVAEEAEKIRQGLTPGRPKRTPKPNKNYDWASIVPLIKPEPGDNAEGPNADQEEGFREDPKRHLSIAPKEDKENKRPAETDPERQSDDCEEEDEEDLENISQPTQPRPPPSKPKGRPHWVRNSNTQTECAYEKVSARPPLREVKVQCNINTDPSSPCSTCSYVNWLRLEELLVECSSEVEGDLCSPQVKECLRKVVEAIPHPTHATNVLKLLGGLKRDEMENTSDIVLAVNKEEEVEIENFIHTALEEETVTGGREITPKIWQKKTKSSVRVKVTGDDEEDDEDYVDGFGIKEATDLDDDEFNPTYHPGESDEGEGMDDEDWAVNMEDKDNRSVAKRRARKTAQVGTKGKKGRKPGGKTQDQEVEGDQAREGQGGVEKSLHEIEHESGTQSQPKTDEGKAGDSVVPASEDHNKGVVSGQKVRSKHLVDARWMRGSFSCPECELVFTTKLKMEQHHGHVHMGQPPWRGSHVCLDCGKVFTQKVGLQVHRMHKHGVPKQFACHLCSHRAVTKGKLNRHLHTHFSDKKWTCEVCGVQLKTRDTLNNHMALHTNEGRYRCKVCHKAFNHKQYYTDHCRSHLSAREYRCVLCNLHFKTNNSLRTHIRAVHLNDKRIVCRVCGAKFMTNFNLQGHMRKHIKSEQSAQSQLQCGLCYVTLNSQSEMKFHLKHVHSHPTSESTVMVLSGDVDGVAGGDGTDGDDEGMNERVSITCVGSGEENEMLQIQSQEIVQGTGDTEQQAGPNLSVIYFFECDKCEETFTSVDLLSQHQVLKHSDEDDYLHQHTTQYPQVGLIQEENTMQ